MNTTGHGYGVSRLHQRRLRIKRVGGDAPEVDGTSLDTVVEVVLSYHFKRIVGISPKAFRRQ